MQVFKVLSWAGACIPTGWSETHERSSQLTELEAHVRLTFAALCGYNLGVPRGDPHLVSTKEPLIEAPFLRGSNRQRFCGLTWAIVVPCPSACHLKGTDRSMPDHHYFSNLIWQIAELFRGPCRPPQYECFMLPMSVLRRFMCLFGVTKEIGLTEYEKRKGGRLEGDTLDSHLNKAVGIHADQQLLATPNTICKLLDPVCALVTYTTAWPSRACA